MSPEDASAPPVPPRLLAGGAVAVALPVLTVGALLVGLGEGGGPKAAGLGLVVAGLVTVGAGVAALRPGTPPRRALHVAVVVLLVAAAVAVGLVLARRDFFVIDLLILGGVPAGAALVLAVLARAAGSGQPRR